jgi:glycosyltransferase involved in cell wall biosynthesis
MAEDPKRMSLIVAAWKRLVETGKYRSWKLVFVGDGPDLNPTQFLAKDLPNVSFEGYRKERDDYYKKASIFLMTSSYEGFGMTLIEAQKFGCVPVVMDSYAVLHDIITDSENGMISPNNDIGAFVATIRQLMDNADLRNRLAQKGLVTIRKFSVERIAEEWEQLFRGAIA